jgi:hypothetical protein
MKFEKPQIAQQKYIPQTISLKFSFLKNFNSIGTLVDLLSPVPNCPN